MNKVVNFETAKLLKEKGYGTFTSFEYDHGANLIPRSYCSPHRLCSAPTIAEVVMWLYEKYGVWVWVEKYESDTKFYPQIPKANLSRVISFYNSPTEAYEAAIEYTLKNLV